MKLTLEACRVNKHLSQEDVVKRLKPLVKTTISLSNWERGVQMPRFDVVKKLAEIYEVNIDDIDIPKRKK